MISSLSKMKKQAPGICPCTCSNNFFLPFFTFQVFSYSLFVHTLRLRSLNTAFSDVDPTDEGGREGRQGHEAKRLSFPQKTAHLFEQSSLDSRAASQSCCTHNVRRVP